MYTTEQVKEMAKKVREAADMMEAMNKKKSIEDALDCMVYLTGYCEDMGAASLEMQFGNYNLEFRMEESEEEP